MANRGRLGPFNLLAQRDRLLNWLETRWVNPAYSGWVLLGLCLFFFAAASNTMAGWLYVMSGIGFALLGVAAWLARRGLTGLNAMRVSSPPVAVGQDLRLEVILSNGDRRAKSLLQIIDPLPKALGGAKAEAVRLIGPGGSHTWRYQQPALRRGLYRWSDVQVRTAAPLGLCWHSQRLPAKAKAVVYPTIVQLSSCPLVDGIGEQQTPSLTPRALPQTATEGLTRSLRPYRWGDPIRRVHWRTSARFGELRVRELEDIQTGQNVVLAIDSGQSWLWLDAPESKVAGLHSSWWKSLSFSYDGEQAVVVSTFELAVATLASLYRYASRHYSGVQIWTASHGLVHGERNVLETLAAMEPGQSVEAVAKPKGSLIWLTNDPMSLERLPAGSAWLFWPGETDGQFAMPTLGQGARGTVMDPFKPLEEQLQAKR